MRGACCAGGEDILIVYASGARQKLIYIHIKYLLHYIEESIHEYPIVNISDSNPSIFQVHKTICSEICHEHVFVGITIKIFSCLDCILWSDVYW